MSTAADAARDPRDWVIYPSMVGWWAYNLRTGETLDLAVWDDAFDCRVRTHDFSEATRRFDTYFGAQPGYSWLTGPYYTSRGQAPHVGYVDYDDD